MRRSIPQARRRRDACSAPLPALAADESGATYGAGKNRFSLATGSPGELGLLKLLAEEPSRRSGRRQMVWVKAGTGPRSSCCRRRRSTW
jgi:hypothetical protein